jgi:hypothetical protein
MMRLLDAEGGRGAGVVSVGLRRATGLRRRRGASSRLPIRSTLEIVAPARGARRGFLTHFRALG